MSAITRQDIGNLPPLDENDEIQTAARMLRGFRAKLKELAPEWQWWVAESLVKGLPPIVDDVVQ